MMKKLVLLISLVLVSAVAANAQLSLGLSSGGVLGADTYKNATVGPGYFGELNVRYLMNNRMYVSFVPRFESSSYQSKASSPDQFYYYTNSMFFPFRFGHVSALSDKVNLFYDLGPSLHWIMTNIHQGPLYGVELSKTVHPITQGYSKRFNMDMGATVGVEVWNHFRVSAGFDFGVLPERTKAFQENFQVADTYPYSFRLGVGYYFSFRKRRQ